MNRASRGFYPIAILVVMALAMAMIKCNMTTGDGGPSIQSLSDDNSLKSLILSGDGSWDREFDPKVLNYTYKVSNSVDSITVTPGANSKLSKITINGRECRSNAMSDPFSLRVNRKNEIIIRVEAENGDVQEYTVIIVRLSSDEDKNDDAALISLTIFGAPLQPAFDPEHITYTAFVPETKIPLDVTATARSSNATIRFKLNGDEVENQHEIDIAGSTATLVAEVTAGDGSTRKKYTVVITRDTDPSESSANLKGIEITFGTKNSKRPIYHSFNEPTKTTFNPAITDYAAVVYACSSITLTATASDSSVTSIVFNDDTDGTHTNGVKTGEIQLTEGVGKVTKVTILVTSRDGSTEKKYNLAVKLLNADEFFWGIYAPNNAKSYIRWREIVPDPGPGTNLTIKGYTSGVLDWWVVVRLLRGKNNIKFTNFSDGNDDRGDTRIYTPYNDNCGVNSQDGFVMNGSTVGDVSLLGYGKQTGSYTLSTPWGDQIGSIYVHVILEDKQMVAHKDSYFIFTYMGGEHRYTREDENPDNFPYPFTADNDWNTPWYWDK